MKGKRNGKVREAKWESEPTRRGREGGRRARHKKEKRTDRQWSLTSSQSLIPIRKSAICHISMSLGSSMNELQSMAFSG